MRGFRPEWLDQLAFAGQVAWGRLWGSSRAALRATPICLFPRADLDAWLGLAAPIAEPELSWPARAIRAELARSGALFPDELLRTGGMLPSDAERGLV